MKDLLSEFFSESLKDRFTFCHRCKYKWIRHKKNKLPKHCPHCCSPYWNKPKEKN